jgi:hypothetical protein
MSEGLAVMSCGALRVTVINRRNLMELPIVGAVLGGFGLFIVGAFGVVLLLLVLAWMILPFALIGTKPLLRELIAETKRTNELLTMGHQLPSTTPAALSASMGPTEPMFR